MTLDLDGLEQLAKSATPGPWLVVYKPDDGREDVVSSATGDRVARCMAADGGPGEPDARYIAALSPDVVLELVSRLRKSEEDVLDAEALALEHLRRAAKAEAALEWIEASAPGSHDGAEIVARALSESKP